MTLGFLHIGDPEHGVTRYGSVLARGIAQHPEVEMMEVATGRLPEGRAGRQHVRDAAASLSAADVVHLQYNERVWGGPLRAPFTARAFADACRAPWIATVHDVRDGYGPAALLRRLWSQRTPAAAGALPSTASTGRPTTGDAVAGKASGLASLLRNAALSVRKALRYMLREAANAWATWRVALRSRRIVVCTREEARRLRSLADPTPVEVIPHFVEPQPTLPSAQAAKQRLGLEGKRVVGVLGFIHRRKGHDRVVNALPHLPDDTVAVFIGRAGRKDTGFARRLQAQAAALGVADRLRITGFVPEDALRDYLAATDVAACPFRSASASGSLSTWIAAERPIVASRLPLFEEYNTYASGALHLVDAAQPRTLADALAASLNASGTPPRAAASEAAAQARARLRSRLSLSTIAARHVALYRRVAAR